MATGRGGLIGRSVLGIINVAVASEASQARGGSAVQGRFLASEIPNLSRNTSAR
jgi:hypothetical protein